MFFLDTSGDKHISHKQTRPIVGSLIVLDDKDTGRGDKKKIKRKREVRRRERDEATEGEMEKNRGIREREEGCEGVSESARWLARAHLVKDCGDRKT